MDVKSNRQLGENSSSESRLNAICGALHADRAMFDAYINLLLLCENPTTAQLLSLVSPLSSVRMSGTFIRMFYFLSLALLIYC